MGCCRWSCPRTEQAVTSCITHPCDDVKPRTARHITERTLYAFIKLLRRNCSRGCSLRRGGDDPEVPQRGCVFLRPRRSRRLLMSGPVPPPRATAPTRTIGLRWAGAERRAVAGLTRPHLTAPLPFAAPTDPSGACRRRFRGTSGRAAGTEPRRLPAPRCGTCGSGGHA